MYIHEHAGIIEISSYDHFEEPENPIKLESIEMHVSVVRGYACRAGNFFFLPLFPIVSRANCHFVRTLQTCPPVERGKTSFVIVRVSFTSTRLSPFVIIRQLLNAHLTNTKLCDSCQSVTLIIIFLLFPWIMSYQEDHSFKRTLF